MLKAERWAALAVVLAVAGCTGTSTAVKPSATSSQAPSPTPVASPVLSVSPTALPPIPYLLTKIGTFSSPVWVGPVPGDPLHLFLVEKTGRLQQLNLDGTKDKVVLDLSKLISHGNEQGLLSMAFDPDFTKNKKFYVDYTDKDGNTQVVAYDLVDGNAHDPVKLLSIMQPYANHNGGLLLFDRTGKLLVGTGDGGSAGDPENRAQDIHSNLGKILRIDPTNGNGLADNPYPGNDRVWALGLRNPWRFSFDTNGDLYVGDVGQNKVEELDVVPPKNQRGANYGWSVYEGNERFKSDEDFTPGGPLITPALTYLHSSGGCSITGGLVYRGKAIPSLFGTYVFGDYCAGKLMGTKRTATGVTPATPLGVRVQGLQGFGVDQTGELLVLSADTMYRLDPLP